MKIKMSPALILAYRIVEYLERTPTGLHEQIAALDIALTVLRLPGGREMPIEMVFPVASEAPSLNQSTRDTLDAAPLDQSRVKLCTKHTREMVEEPKPRQSHDILDML